MRCDGPSDTANACAIDLSESIVNPAATDTATQISTFQFAFTPGRRLAAGRPNLNPPLATTNKIGGGFANSTESGDVSDRYNVTIGPETEGSRAHGAG